MKSGAKMLLSFIAGAIAAAVVFSFAHRAGPEGPAVQPAERPTAPPFDATRSRMETSGPVPARASDAAVPAAGGPTNSSSAQPGEQARRAEIASLKARIRELETQSASSTRQEEDRSNGIAGLPPGTKFHDFTDRELQAMAENCQLRFDLPGIGSDPFEIPPDTGARLHLSEAEQSQVAAAVDATKREVIQRLRGLYAEATGNPAAADDLDPQSLMNEILQKSPPAAVYAARVKIAQERAGLARPADPNSGTIAERYFRLMVSVGDSLQRRLEQVLGAHGAAATRDALTSSRSIMSGCRR